MRKPIATRFLFESCSSACTVLEPSCVLTRAIIPAADMAAVTFMIRSNAIWHLHRYASGKTLKTVPAARVKSSVS